MGSLFVLALAMAAAPPNEAADAAVIEKMVLDAQRAGFERHDHDKYMSRWASDAKLILGRSEKPGKYDVVFNRDQIESSRNLLFHGKSEHTLGFENVRVDVDGDRAELRVQATTKWRNWATTMQESYRLKRTAAAWKVYENRAWPIVSKHKGKVVLKYDAATWKRLDAKVNDARSESPAELGWELASAFRFSEAFGVTTRLTTRDDVTAEHWLQRGITAIQIGNTKDAITSFSKARKLDPQTELPGYARAYFLKKGAP